jgi:hypothetical protein
VTQQHPCILDLSDDERVSYNMLIQALAARPYHGEHITVQVVDDLQALAQTDETTARVAQRLIDLLHHERSIPKLIAALPTRSLAYPAALLLGWFGPRAAMAATALVEAIGWGPTIGVGAAATSLRHISGDVTPLIEGLSRALHEMSDDAFVQLVGVAEDMQLRTDPRFVAILDAAAQSPNQTIRERAAEMR